MLNPFYLFAWHEKKKVKITHNATSKAEKKRKKREHCAGVMIAHKKKILYPAEKRRYAII